MNNMTAKVSCFARAYHYKNNNQWVFKDGIAEMILGDKDYLSIADNMAKGIQFFAPGFTGDASEALRFIVNHQLSPSVLGRSACEKYLMNEVVPLVANNMCCLRQVMILFHSETPLKN